MLTPPPHGPRDALLGALDAASLGTWDYDVASGAVTWDGHAAALFGRSAATPGTLETLASCVHPQDRAAAVRAVTASVRAGAPLDLHCRVLRPSGEERHLLCRGGVLLDDAGEVARVLGACVDVTELHRASRTLEQALLEQSESVARLAGIAETALQLTSATTVDELVRIVLDRGTAVLGADGGAVSVRDDERGVVRLSVTESLGEQTALDYAELPLDSPLGAAVTARTGEVVLLPDRASGLRMTPLMAQVHATTGRLAWAVLPLQVGGRLLGSLVVSWVEEREFTEAELELLSTFAAQCALALDRIQHLQAERRQTAAARTLSERLQRSLLTRPPQVDHLQIAVRYAPAAEGARIGGDWYDALLGPDGALLVVIGDCAGHDQEAAAAMASVRNLLRATAYAGPAAPSRVLASLEGTMAGLEVDALATAVLARVEQPLDLEQTGLRRVVWSNAGHLPPLLHRGDGTTALLRREADLLLGLAPGAERHDHDVVLDPCSTLLLFTDGLVERRGEDIDEGLERLRGLLGELGPLPLEELCDALLARSLPPEGSEDDVALLALRFHPQDGPRPPEAGPAHTPDATTAGSAPREDPAPRLA